MRALIDRHQADLYYAMQLLFEDRLDIELFTPVGHEWWDEGYWQFGAVFGDDRLAQQYIVPNAAWTEFETGCYTTHDPAHPYRTIYGISLAQARKLDWDYSIATVQENQLGFWRFAQERHAKYVYQVGNTRQQILWHLDPLAILTSEMPIEGRGVRVHQPFDHDTTFRFRDPAEATKQTASFVNLAPRIETWPDNLAIHAALPEYVHRTYGIDGGDGNLKPVARIADEMARSRFGLHLKPTGDGFGHILHNWAAVGRPIIGRSRFYAGQLSEHFWQDGVTCFDLDRHSVSEIAERIRTLTDEEYAGMCRAMRAELDRIDWKAETQLVAELLA